MPRTVSQALGPVLHANHVAHADLVAGDVDAAAVDGDVAVANNLPGLGAAEAEAQAMHDVVQPALQQAHQRVAGVALALRRRGRSSRGTAAPARRNSA